MKDTFLLVKFAPNTIDNMTMAAAAVATKVVRTRLFVCVEFPVYGDCEADHEGEGHIV